MPEPSPADPSRMRWLALILAAFGCMACVKPIALNAAIEPSLPHSDRSSEKAGVVCGEGLLSHVERAHPSTLVGFATTYEFELGEPLCNALLRSVESSYRAAQRAAAPHKGQYGRVIEFELRNSSLSIVPQAAGSTRVAYTLTVVVEERYGFDLRQIGRNVVTGNSLVDCKKLTNQVVQDAVEAALQQVADSASDLLVARIDGPRVPAALRR